MESDQLLPEILNDKSRLEEIYRLRVFCHENSVQNKFINSTYFPEGWKDKFDEDAIQWIIESENKIIASARVCILNHVNEIEEDFTKFSLPNARPFAYFSRLVVHPSFRGLKLSNVLDHERIKYIKNNNIQFALAYVESMAGRKSKLVSLGFEELGTFKHKYYNNPKIKDCIAFILYLDNISL